MEIPFLTKKNRFHAPVYPFQGIIVYSGQKLTQINKKATLKVLLFFLHVKNNL